MNLENLKKRVFSERENYVKEIDTAIHSLKGNALHLSFSVIAKIMENLLEDKLMENADFKGRYKVKLEKKGRKNLNFGNLIDFAKDKEYFDENSVNLLNEIKVLRNDSVHEISPDTDQNILIIFHNKMIELIAYVEFETWGVTQVEEEA